MATELVRDLQASDFGQAVSQGYTLVDFWAPWCGPCRMMAPVLDQIAAAEPTLSVAKVNVDDNPSLAARFRVQSIPLLVLLEDGRELTRFVGLQQPAALRKEIRRHMS